jgi:hypothetical protein
MLKKLSNALLNRSSTCAACGNEFSCGVSLRGCWCSEIKLSEATRADLSSRFRGCLCRTCLEQLAEREVVTATIDNDR